MGPPFHFSFTHSSLKHQQATHIPVERRGVAAAVTSLLRSLRWCWLHPHPSNEGRGSHLGSWVWFEARYNSKSGCHGRGRGEDCNPGHLITHCCHLFMDTSRSSYIRTLKVTLHLSLFPPSCTLAPTLSRTHYIKYIQVLFVLCELVFPGVF